ncbi:MAG: GNAT family N-acetyltransferase [Hyphomicrobiaceae bacterium]|nr:GNAT family N-acetyltransferase [Hyphomicrobiaceae bacterium]
MATEQRGRDASPASILTRLAPLARRQQALRAPHLGGFDPEPETLGRIGSLEVRLAVTPREVKKAQRLRYKVFYKEMSATADAATRLTRRDADAFDALCDHLLVIDHDPKGEPFRPKKPKIVGTYRLLRQEIAAAHGGFYTSGEYDIGPMLAAHPTLNFLELGRSCVLKPYRTKRTVELLWAGIWAYIRRHDIDAMFGCASLEGTDPKDLALPLSFLHHHAGAAGEWGVRALPGRRVDMNLMAPEAIDLKKAMQALPPLIKGYLRLGGRFGDGAVIDHQFGTTDVFVVLPVSAIGERYITYYTRDDAKPAN